MQRLGLLAASVPIAWGVQLRNRLYDYGWKKTFRAAVPVISVGNLTLGGTGKTPCVEYLARFYRQQDLRVAILSRGYGSASGPNDEALVLEENLPDVPHLLGVDRVALAQLACEELESEVLVLDDGFQHRRLSRDLDLVLIDATEPLEQSHLFPRGLLRESVGGLNRASVVVLTRCDQVKIEVRQALRAQATRHCVAGTPIVEASHRPKEWVNSAAQTMPLAFSNDRPLAAFCGIGNPDAFRHTLEALDASPRVFRAFPDHHAYSRADVDDLQAWARSLPQDCVIATTQKDLVKLRLPRLGGRELWALRIELQVEAGQEILHERLQAALRN
jgi:tetraacyldisaccharide 4'-kinase